MIILPADAPMTPELLAQLIEVHKRTVEEVYQPLVNAYCNDYPIFHLPKKEPCKPDSRISVNFAKFITDTLNGFFIGNPVVVTSEDQSVNDYVQALDAYNNQDDKNSELSKMCSIYGHAYEHYYVDENSKICLIPLAPTQAFMVYDDSINHNPLYFVRYYKDYYNVTRGELCDATSVTVFMYDGTIVFDPEPRQHGFDGVPATEYAENEEKIGVFASALPAINAYNKALSEKANEVDYFSDSYLVILGGRLQQGSLRFIRENRIINFPNEDGDSITVEFLERPSGDSTQEHLLDRLEEKIYQTSMVCNTADEAFGTSSGEALKLKLRPMINLARTKERKFEAGMNRRYKLVFSNPCAEVPADAWTGLSYKFTFDVPNNLSDEAITARNLTGIVSEETVLKTLSCVEDVQKEIEQLKEDRSEGLTDEEDEHGHEHVLA